MSDLEHFGTPCDLPVDPITGYCDCCHNGFTGEAHHCECGNVTCQYCCVQCEQCERHGCKDCMVEDGEGSFFCNPENKLKDSECYIEWRKDD